MWVYSNHILKFVTKTQNYLNEKYNLRRHDMRKKNMNFIMIWLLFILFISWLSDISKKKIYKKKLDLKNDYKSLLMKSKTHILVKIYLNFLKI